MSTQIGALEPGALAARLDRLPIGRFHRRILAALAFGFFFDSPT